MAFTTEQGYSQIKNPENSRQLNLPKPREVVTVGTVDASMGTFTWSVPTFVQTTVIPPLPPEKKNTIINNTCGLVTTTAVDLALRFAVKRVPLKNRATARAGDVPVGQGGPPSGVKISLFPTIVDVSREIELDAGLALSSVLPDSPNVTPPVTNFQLVIQIPNHSDVRLTIVIARPPVLGTGAFTIPAVPTAIVYAPPQGRLQKNTASYSDMTSFSRTVTTSISQGQTVKTADAYSALDYIAKVGEVAAEVDAVIAVAAVVALPAGAGGRHSGSGRSARNPEGILPGRPEIGRCARGGNGRAEAAFGGIEAAEHGP